MYNFINDIRQKAKCPPIDTIMIDFDFNAFITEIPQIGMIGWNKRYLVIGFPLMLTLSVNELAAVVAHECAHLSNADGKTGVNIYRARNLWSRISDELKKVHKDRSFLIRVFMHRYIIALNNYYYKISKQQEYEADRTAALVTSKEAVASSLLRLNLYDTYLDAAFWNEVRQLNMNDEIIPDNIYLRLEKASLQCLPDDFYAHFIDDILKYRSLPGDTHPSYIERIESLCAELPIIKAIQENSIRTIFQAKSDNVIGLCSRAWGQQVKDRWSEHYNQAQKARDRLADLKCAFKENSLDLSGRLEMIELIEQIQGIDDAITNLSEMKNDSPDCSEIDYNLGRLLLYKNDKDGIRLLEEVIKKDFQLIPACTYELVNYYCLENDPESAAEYYNLAEEVLETNEEIKSERENILNSDEFIPHDLSHNTILKLIESLSGYKEIEKAYVVIKYTELSYQFPIYVIGIRYKSCKWDKIQDQLTESGLLPWTHWFTNLGKNPELEYKFSMVPDSRIL
jgi:Zn-dependent protease with chaperone function